jgi:hypothetical protein
MLVALLSGAVVLLPALVYLYVLFQRSPAPGSATAAPTAVRSGDI